MPFVLEKIPLADVCKRMDEVAHKWMIWPCGWTPDGTSDIISYLKERVKTLRKHKKHDEYKRQEKQKYKRKLDEDF